MPVAGSNGLAAQLAHLETVAHRPHIEIRVLPERINLATRFNGAFYVFKTPAGFPEVAYRENFAGRMYLESPRSPRERRGHREPGRRPRSYRTG
ncbi:Scr1 family TA system antitoxin-like transcriptional regulator [Plantactinospora sp. DSM 117369]